jgi:hypothetical protein
MAVDHHILRRIYFYDFSSFGLFYEPKFTFSYRRETFEFSLQSFYRHIGRTKGDSYERAENSEYAFLQTSKAGAALSFFSTRFLFRVHL